MGKRAALGLRFGGSRDEITTSLAEAAEATQLREAGEPLAVHEISDIDPALARLRVSGVLAPEDLTAVMGALALARTLRRSLHAKRATCPALLSACGTDPTLDDALAELSRCFDDDGSLSDRASARLRELRSEVATSRARMRSRLDDLMAKHEGIVQDRFVTEREGRYVIPVRADAHERFPGIVHATSGSGSTLFVEPRAVIPMGNRLKMLEGEVLREELAVYARLSSLLAEVLPSLEAATLALTRADVVAATATLAVDLRLTFPIIDGAPRMALQGARHPLLALDALATGRGSVVPSDLSIESRRAVVVSGPNAGGKTVALKTMGLAALMVRAGLPIACDAGSRIGLFEVVLTDVGDDQNLTKNLSTFSAHVENLRAILEDTRPGALVLLDEVAGGTDPREGEALAAGVLDSLAARGGAVVATTHYEGLKALALADDRFENASVGFDVTTMTPTFRVTFGIPGSSSALAVAARFGLPQTVIERARCFLTHEEQSFETLVAKLHSERAALDLARQAALAREEALRATQEKLEEELLAAQDREERALSKEGEALLASLRRAKDDLRAAQAKLRAKDLGRGALREAGRAIDRVATSVALGGELEAFTTAPSAETREAIETRELRKGAQVYVPKLRAEALVLEVAGERVRVAVGGMKLTVDATELRAAAPSATPPTEKPRPSRSRSSDVADASPIQTSDNTCDLRGLRADDGVGMATAFLDRSIGEGRRVAFLVHGHGTGSLREAVRRELTQSQYVSRFRPGGPSEGGDGVTIVWLA
jgi:DNA mismatch repair protein MutS2